MNDKNHFRILVLIITSVYLYSGSVNAQSFMMNSSFTLKASISMKESFLSFARRANRSM